MARGLFIVFEGTDGSGLTTQAALLAEFLQKRGKQIMLTKEPTNNYIGQLIRIILKKEQKASPLALQLLFSADRAHHLATEIEPALAAGKTVICDRYILSTLAFGTADGNDLEFLKKINERFRVPDATFVIDVPPDVAIERIKKSRGEFELFEEKQKFEKIRANYLKLKNLWPNIFIIDGNRPRDVVFQDVWAAAEKILAGGG